MANTHFSKAKIGQKSKKSENKKVAPPGFEPGSLDPKSDALPLSYGGGEFLGQKIDVFEVKIRKNFPKFKNFTK